MLRGDIIWVQYNIWQELVVHSRWVADWEPLPFHVQGYLFNI